MAHHEHGDDGADDLLVAARTRRPGLQGLLPSARASLAVAVALDRDAGPPAPVRLRARPHQAPEAVSPGTPSSGFSAAGSRTGHQGAAGAPVGSGAARSPGSPAPRRHDASSRRSARGRSAWWSTPASRSSSRWPTAPPAPPAPCSRCSSTHGHLDHLLGHPGLRRARVAALRARRRPRTAGATRRAGVRLQRSAADARAAVRPRRDLGRAGRRRRAARRPDPELAARPLDVLHAPGHTEGSATSALRHVRRARRTSLAHAAHG